MTISTEMIAVRAEMIDHIDKLKIELEIYRKIIDFLAVRIREEAKKE